MNKITINFKPGMRWSDLKATEMQQLVEALNAFIGFTAGGGLDLLIGAGGASLQRGGPLQVQRCELTSTFSGSPAKATAKFLDRNGSTQISGSRDVYDPFGIYDNYEGDERGYAVWDGIQWDFVPAECPGGGDIPAP